MALSYTLTFSLLIFVQTIIIDPHLSGLIRYLRIPNELIIFIPQIILSAILFSVFINSFTIIFGSEYLYIIILIIIGVVCIASVLTYLDPLYFYNIYGLTN
ncbi:MAG: hypothetical protein J7K59_07380, partial [Candidatus Korarchaeota archaeon]|nr:hypothetical protein [Candidatus Korarchaeota archaeon]